MGSFNPSSPPSRESLLAPNPDSADFAVFLVRFAEGTSSGLPQKISLFAGGASQPLSLKKLVQLRGVHTSTLQNSILYRCQGLQHCTLQKRQVLSHSLTFLIYPLPSHLILSHYSLMFCPFSAPIGLRSFELLSLSRSHQFRRIPDLTPRAPRSGIKECDEEDVEARITCVVEDCGFQMLNDDEIVISVQEESDPVDDETDEDEDNNNNESS
ncbi:hypothetical protein TNCV_3563161 [Trichonephila clavipes]|nr:hypothetical protein TNCV_3563161 [Trichonephila clavipes]